jgi:hypothetical protein
MNTISVLMKQTPSGSSIKKHETHVRIPYVCRINHVFLYLYAHSDYSFMFTLSNYSL